MADQPKPIRHARRREIPVPRSLILPAEVRIGEQPPVYQFLPSAIVG